MKKILFLIYWGVRLSKAPFQPTVFGSLQNKSADDSVAALAKLYRRLHRLKPYLCLFALPVCLELTEYVWETIGSHLALFDMQNSNRFDILSILIFFKISLSILIFFIIALSISIFCQIPLSISIFRMALSISISISIFFKFDDISIVDINIWYYINKSGGKHQNRLKTGKNDRILHQFCIMILSIV